jgi:MFS transporter, PPP family, 3-phenylpropionic acid transporter
VPAFLFLRVVVMHHLPYWRLSGFYFVYFAFVGAFAPYWSLYLKSLEFSAFQIGVLMSLLQVARIFAPNLWGWLADHSGRRVRVVQLAAGLSLACYLGVFAGDDFVWLFIVMATMSFFWSASLPLVEAITLGHLREAASGYGRIRLWGSIGFIVSVIGLGYFLDYAPVRALLWVVLGLKIGVLAISRWIPEPHIAPHHNDRFSVLEILKRPEVAAFFTATFMMAVAHGVYYTFYSIYLVDHGYSKTAVGWLWAIGVICEVLVFLWMPRLAVRFGLRKILLVSFALAALRFELIGWGVGSVVVIIFAQILHAASFGSYHAAAVAVTHQFFPGRHQARGQALYTSISFGLGGTLGGLMSGYAWESFSPAWAFSLSGFCALLGMGMLAWRLHLPQQPLK